ncbi:helix-turn-helix transcriptional regulator [Streptomyces decoyicus]|nr:helix-turn-helix transcriptional regulator [Streptomyces decoyicus]
MFGEVLKHFREAAGFTQEELSNKIPCDRSQVARVEAGTRVPQDTFAKQCDELLGTGGVLLRLWGADRLVSGGAASGLVRAAGGDGCRGGGPAGVSRAGDAGTVADAELRARAVQSPHH